MLSLACTLKNVIAKANCCASKEHETVDLIRVLGV